MSRIPRIGALAAGKDPADSLITRVMDLSQMTNDLGPDKSGVLGSDAHRIHRDHSASMLLAHLCCSVGGARRRADSSTNFAIPIFHPLGCPQARGLLGVEFIGSDCSTTIILPPPVGFQQGHDASETLPLSSSAQATTKQDELGTMGLGGRLPRIKTSGKLLHHRTQSD